MCDPLSPYAHAEQPVGKRQPFEKVEEVSLGSLLIRNRRKRATRDRMKELEHDVGFLALTLAALLQKVEEKGVLTREEVRDSMDALDGLDGVRDGKIDVGILKDADWGEREA